MPIHCRATIGPFMFELQKAINGGETEVIILTVVQVAVRLSDPSGHLRVFDPWHGWRR
jgi:hypothetical protein